MADWKPINTAPKSTSTPAPRGWHVEAVYLLGFCPDESATDPMSCMCIVWWEPHIAGGSWSGELGCTMRPTHWMELPTPPATPMRDATVSEAS